MSDMKCPVCPWCNQPKVLQDDIFVCANTDCSACAESFLHKALIQAKQDLEIAKNGLHRVITKTNSQVVRGFEYIATGIVKVAKDTLKQIEHKDVK